MNKELYFAMLNQGNTGDEIMNILDAIINSEIESDSTEPTLEPIDF